MNYDVIVIGSGIGGLVTAAVLAKSGMKICVLEQNKQVGGNLQTFSRNKQLFDTGVHYLGGLDKGENLYQIFKYLDIIQDLAIERMDAVFDYVLIENDENQYPFFQGYEQFIKGLSDFFPEEHESLKNFCTYIKELCLSYPLYNLETTANTELYKGTNESIITVLSRFIKNKKLQKVLLGNSLLYALDKNKTPFHVYALILNSYIQSAWKCTNGGSEIAKLLVKSIHQNNGVVKKHCKIIHIKEEGGIISYVQDDKGYQYKANIYVSNIHPQNTLQMLDSTVLRNVYKQRIFNLTNTISSFSIHATLKQNKILYQNHNYYFQTENGIENAVNYDDNNWPKTYGLYFIQDRKNPEFASAISILTYMRFDEVKVWAKSFNTVLNPSHRPEEYQKFKTYKAEKLLSVVSKNFSDIVNAIDKIYVATPLTNRDYIGNDDGNMYGIAKDYQNASRTSISPRTKIDNLFFTGQCINLHGILGSSLSAILCASLILKDDTLIQKIKDA